MSAMQRRKGQRGEREVVDMLSAVPGWRPKRATQAHDGADYCDVEGTPHWIECKAQKRPSVYAAIDQAREASDGRPVLVFTKRDRDEWYVTLSALEYVRLRAAHEATKAELFERVAAEQLAKGHTVINFNAPAVAEQLGRIGRGQVT